MLFGIERKFILKCRIQSWGATEWAPVSTNWIESLKDFFFTYAESINWNMQREYSGEWRSVSSWLYFAVVCGKVVSSKPNVAVFSYTHSSWEFLFVIAKPRSNVLVPSGENLIQSYSEVIVRHLFTLEQTEREARLVRTNTLSFAWAVSPW